MVQLNRVLEQIRRLLTPAEAGASSDGQLLARHVRHGDDDAFRELVRRHGPMVRAVCQRVLRDPNDVDDAFQATFLVLVRKAANLRQPERLASWLHGVACRVAANVRRAAAQRQAHERESFDARSVAAADEDVVWRDLRVVLDEELERLPDKYRVPIIHCYLEGKTNEESARELGWTKGTVSGRLARARELLQGRLTRRGVALSTAGLGSVLANQAASAALSELIIENTVAAARAYATGSAASGVAVSLAQGVLRDMSLHRLKIAVTVVVSLACLLGGAGFLLHRDPGAGTPAVAAPLPAEPAKKVEIKGEITLASVYFTDPLLGVHQIGIQGTLDGAGKYHPDGNDCTLNSFGNPAGCTRVAFGEVDIQFKRRADLTKDDPQQRAAFDLVGTPKPMRLVLGGTCLPRLLVLDEAGTVLRVVSLEPQPMPKAAIEDKVQLHSEYLHDAFSGGHRVRIDGTLDGAAELTLNGNVAGLNALGDVTVTTRMKAIPHKVKLVLKVASHDKDRSQRIYDVEGAPAPMRLVIMRDGPRRLLAVDKDGKVTRVVPLENGRRAAPPPAEPARKEDNKKEETKGEVKLRSVYLVHPFVKAHTIEIEGKLGGAGTILLDGNTCNLDSFGNRRSCTEARYNPVNIEFRRWPEAKGDDKPIVKDVFAVGPKRQAFDLIGAPEPMRLVVPEAGLPRLVLLDKAGKVLRVVLLEPQPMPKAAIEDKIHLHSAYLNDALSGAHRVRLEGNLVDAVGWLWLDRNGCNLTEFGDTGACTLLPAVEHKVKLVLKSADKEKNKRIYDLVGAPEPMHLVIERDGPRRLLVLDKEGQVMRVVPLESVK
jgi:RNA polymerase sigma factor (sigma-70 family)